MVKSFDPEKATAGPGLDRLVGSTLMGACKHEHVETISYHGAYGWVAVLRCMDCDESPPFDRPFPQYSTDLNEAYKVEEKIRELGLAEAYSKALHTEIAESTPGYFTLNRSNDIDIFLVVHATPQQRCKAALRAFDLLKER